MKKIRLFVIVGIVLMLTVTGVILFYDNANKIFFIKNTKKAVEYSNEAKTIDVTNLSDNGNLEHEHIIKTNYDSNRHWDECIICGQKSNLKNHTYTDSWTQGSADACHESNMHVFICKCGYSYENSIGRKAHTNFSYGNNPGSYEKYMTCSICNGYFSIHKCIRNDGKEIDCLNLGTCKLCNYTYIYDKVFHYQNHYVENEKDDLYCTVCNTTYIGKGNRCELVKESDNVFKLYSSVIMPAGAVYSYCYTNSSFGSDVLVSYDVSQSGQIVNGITTITFTTHNENKDRISFAVVYRLNGREYRIATYTPDFGVDTENPVISNINISDNSSDSDWKKIKPITITGTENYCSNVSVKIEDDERNEIFNGKASVSNNNYSIQCTPQIEADQYGRKFIATVTDTLGNSSEQEFTIRKVDSTAPVPVSENNIGVDYWAKSKEFTFKASDKGIGNISIAFNDSNDLGLATGDGEVYSRDYIFIGDVYTPKELSVLYKDELGNTSIQKVIIDKLDNTIPTITNVSIHNNKLLVTANDVKQGFGEGSGVAKYRYLASTDKLENPEITLDNSVEVLKNEEIVVRDIYKMKYIYVVAEDLVRKCE